MELNVVNARMGQGKTSAAINYINNSSGDEHFIFCTPYLSEVERIKSSCVNKEFVEPQEDPTKKEGLKKLIAENRNIVITHALFMLFDQDIRQLLLQRGYILILDETITPIESLHISQGDALSIREFLATEADEFGCVKWTQDSYTAGSLKYIRDMCFSKTLYDTGSQYVKLFPIENFRAFCQVFILTYMYESSIISLYFNLFHIEPTYWWIDGTDYTNYTFVQEKINYYCADYSQLIHICDNEKMNEIGDPVTALSKHWYQTHKDEISVLKNHLYNFFRWIAPAKSNERMWTSFKDYQHKLKGKGYTKGFIPCNLRASNEFRNKTAIAYPVNRYISPVFIRFFENKGVTVDEDGFALSEMLQFIWRSAIRDNKEINIYIPSSRMRNLLVGWINNNK